MNKNDLYELPHSWVWTRMGEVADVNMGQSPPSSTYNKEKIGLPFYQGKTDFGSLSPTPRIWCSLPSKTADVGDVLISVRAPVGPTNLCTEKSCIGRGLAAIRPRLGMPSMFTLFYLRSIERNLSQMGAGTTFGAIRRSDLESYPFPLAPLDEQKRIVAKVESLFAESKAARKALDKILVLIQKFRESILAKTFRGELTKRDTNDEPAEKLLARIKQQRKKGKQTLLLKKEVLPFSGSQHLPEGWIWARLGEISHIVKEKVEPVEKPEKAFNYFSIGNIESNTGNLVDFSPTLGKNIHSAKLVFTTEDVLYSKLRPYLNKVHVPLFPGISSTDLVPIRAERGIPREYIAYFLRTQKVVEYANQRVRGIQLPRLPVKELLSLPVPIAPLEEQKRIVARIEEVFSFADHVEFSVEKAKVRVDKIDQAILAKAFKGKLVPQDPDDEPASTLLLRIKGNITKKKRKIRPPIAGEQMLAKPSRSLILILKEMGQSPVEQVFQASGLSTSDFWDALKTEIEAGRIEQIRKGRLVFLKVKS